MGNNSGLGIHFHLQQTTLTIRDNVMMGPHVKIIGGGHRFSKRNIPMNQQGFEPISELIIGNDVWIGNSVIILGKVKKQETVSLLEQEQSSLKTFQIYAIVGGNPARILKYRE